MSAAIALALAAVLGLIAALHLYWAFGGRWPGRDEAELIRKVMGQPQMRRMPPVWMTAVVAGAIAVTAFVPLLVAGIVRPPLPAIAVTIVGILIAAVFLVRGIAGFVPAWRRIHSAEPFATRDRRLFSPLCLLLAAGYAVLLVGGARQ